MIEGDFHIWMGNYGKFTHKAQAVLGARVPNEHPQLLEENMTLPALLREAYEHKAYAFSQYARVKEVRKPTHVQMWAKEHTAGTCDTIKERLNAVARMLKVLDSEK